MRSRFLLLIPAMLAAGPVIPAILDPPGNARLVAEETEAMARTRLPVSVWADGAMESIALAGALHRQAWQIPVSQLSSLQLLAPLRRQLEASGFTTLFECADRECGGFEFRYALDLLPEPGMHVDLGDFHYLVARRTGATGDQHIGIVVSRSAERGFLHLTRVDRVTWGATGAAVPEITGETVAALPAPEARRGPQPLVPTGDLIGRLERNGRAVLSGLSFEPGSARLAEEPFDTLAALARWMTDNPESRIVLVGHTDAEGTLDANIELSRKRANAVRDRLTSAHGIAPDRVTAEGVGFLAPLASNVTEGGRTLNRRVEVVRTDTE